MLVDAVPAFALLASRVAYARFYSCERIKILQYDKSNTADDSKLSKLTK